MKIKALLAILCMGLLVGCSSSTITPEVSDKGLYEGLDGKETYSAVIKKMNDEVTYYLSNIEDNGNTSTNETYKLNNQFCFISKAVYTEGDAEALFYTITQGTNFHTLYLGANKIYAYNMVEDYPNEVTEIYKNYLDNTNYSIYDVQRDDQGDQIVLTLKMKMTEEYALGDAAPDEVTRYAIDEMTINEDGFISQEKLVYYTNDQFKEVSETGRTVKNSDFNKKGQSDFDKEIELMKSCDGLQDDDAKEKLGLK